jgi:Protein of unknown function (DUF1579)
MPGPEVARLDYFVGSWSVEGIIPAGSWGVGGPFSWTDKTEWLAGNFFVVGHWDFKMPVDLGGDGQEIFVMGYDLQRKVYTFDAFSSQGRHVQSTGKVAGDIWIWESEATYEEKKVQQRYTTRILSPDRYEVKFEICEDGNTWMTFMEGTATKK